MGTHSLRSRWTLSRIRVVCDWVQYRSSFRDVVDIRPILAAHGADSALVPAPLAAVVTEGKMEVAIDVCRCCDVPLTERTRDLLRRCRTVPDPPRTVAGHQRERDLEFNALYW